MTKLVFLFVGFAALFAGCSGDPSDSQVSAPPEPTVSAVSAVPTVTTDDTVTPTPIVVPTIVAGQGTSTPDTTATPVPETSATAVPTETATPTATVAPTATPTVTPAPPIPTVAPTATRVPPTPIPATPTPRPAWVNPDCYVGPGPADGPVWWCGGKICIFNALHYGCPTTTPTTFDRVEVGCTISDRHIVVNEIITLRATQDPAHVPVVYAFRHGDGAIDRTPESRAFYRSPGTYDVIMDWHFGLQQGSIFCGSVKVVAAPGPSPTPTPTVAPADLRVRCVISKDTVRVNENLRFTAVQDPADAAVSYVFNHGDGTLDPTNSSLAFYVAPGFYNVSMQWSYGGQQGDIFCGTVTVLPEFNSADFTGRSLAAAEAVAATQGLSTRVVRVDDEWFAVTQDYRIDRVNFEIDDGLVTKATLG